MPHVQVRNVPPKVHRILKLQAANAGVSLNEYLLGAFRQLAETPTTEELIHRVRSRKLYAFEESSAEVLRRERPEG
jgi:plasmid stability protein